jgi:hypothetical protein
MPTWDQGEPQPFQSFGKGINRDDPPTVIPEGHYDDAQNMLLYSDSSGQHMASMKKDVLLDDAITWPTGNLYWFAPFTYSTYVASTGVLSFETHLLMLRSTGQFHRYDAGDPGTTTNVRRTSGGLGASQLTTHFVYDQWLVILNGRDAPMKYGQHFRFDGQGHETPYLFPLGSKPVSPLDPSITGETVTLGGASAYVADASVPGGGARVGTHALSVAASATVRIHFSATRDFRAGPRPYGGTNFANTDFFQFQYYKAADAGGITVRFYKTYNTVYRTYTSTTSTTGAWTLESLARTGTDTGGFVDADMATITDIEIISSDAANATYIDDMYFLYANAPPAGQVGTAHKDRIVLGGVPTAGVNDDPALSTLFWTEVEKPDEFPSSNTQIIAGGSQSLSRTNRIAVLREYGDAVIVGTQNSIFAWTIGTDGVPSRSVITTETGIDSPRAISETPSGSLIFPWQRGFYILRQTGRNYVSQKIQPLLQDIWLEEPWWTIGVRDELTKTIRFWFRERFDVADDDPTATTNGIVFDYVRAQDSGAAVWPSRMTQLVDYATEAYVDGVREVLYCRFSSQQVWRLHVQEGGTLESSVTLPWLGTQGRDKLTRWTGINVPYAATADVRVFARYANNPGEFANAEFEELQHLGQNPDIRDPAHVPFGRSAKYIQIKFQAQEYGFELYPPLTLIAAPRPALKD